MCFSMCFTERFRIVSRCKAIYEPLLFIYPILQELYIVFALHSEVLCMCLRNCFNFYFARLQLMNIHVQMLRRLRGYIERKKTKHNNENCRKNSFHDKRLI